MTMTETRVSVAEMVAANVRAEAARRGYSQVSLGRALGLSQGIITRRWKCAQPWTLDEIDALAYLFGIDPAALFRPAPGVRGRSARLKGLEPPTFWFGVARDWMVAA